MSDTCVYGFVHIARTRRTHAWYATLVQQTTSDMASTTLPATDDQRASTAVQNIPTAATRANYRTSTFHSLSDETSHLYTCTCDA